MGDGLILARAPVRGWPILKRTHVHSTAAGLYRARALAHAGLGLTLLVAAPLGAVNRPDVAAVWKDYVVAKKRLQYDLSRLVTRKWPELKAVADLQRDQQFAEIELRNMEFQYLLQKAPERIVTDRGISAFAEFEWAAADGDALRRVNPDFAKLERWAEKNARRLAEHPKYVIVQERIGSLREDERYRSMKTRFEQRLADLERALTAGLGPAGLGPALDTPASFPRGGHPSS